MNIAIYDSYHNVYFTNEQTQTEGRGHETWTRIQIYQINESDALLLEDEMHIREAEIDR